MTLTRILLPTDFSDTAQHAHGYARELAVRFNASVHLLHVVSDPTPQDWAVGATGVVVADLLRAWTATPSGVWRRPRWRASRPCGRSASVTRSSRSSGTPRTRRST